jgi:histidinol phosphatase-like PHP family hydrolase
MKIPRDVNAEVAALLFDAAAAYEGTPRHWGYRRAAQAIWYLGERIEGLSERELAAIPCIGPATLRIIREVRDERESPSVARSVEESPKREAVLKARSLRDNFMSASLVAWVLEQDLPGTVNRGDYLGDFQMHSTDSDGAETVEGMAEACRRRGYLKAAITDHTHGLPIARGMTLQTMRRQQKEIDRLNARVGTTFRLFKGVEANLLADGALDLAIEDRRDIDLVVASPHAKLRLATDQTPRMLAAVSEPGVHILGHPRGRVFGTRAGIIAEWPAVFRRAAETRVAIELDGDPSRQDLDASLAREALAAGCLFALDSDAHAIDELHYADYALAHARLAGIPRDRIVNCWTDDALLEWSAAAWDR